MPPEQRFLIGKFVGQMRLDDRQKAYRVLHKITHYNVVAALLQLG